MAYVLESRCGRVQFGGHLSFEMCAFSFCRTMSMVLSDLRCSHQMSSDSDLLATEIRWRHANSILIFKRGRLRIKNIITIEKSLMDVRTVLRSLEKPSISAWAIASIFFKDTISELQLLTYNNP